MDTARFLGEPGAEREIELDILRCRRGWLGASKWWSVVNKEKTLSEARENKYRVNASRSPDLAESDTRSRVGRQLAATGMSTGTWCSLLTARLGLATVGSTGAAPRPNLLLFYSSQFCKYGRKSLAFGQASVPDAPVSKFVADGFSVLRNGT